MVPTPTHVRHLNERPVLVLALKAGSTQEQPEPPFTPSGPARSPARLPRGFRCSPVVAAPRSDPLGSVRLLPVTLGCVRLLPVTLGSRRSRAAPPRSDALSGRLAGARGRRRCRIHSHVPVGSRLPADPGRLGPQDPRQRRAQPSVPAGLQEGPARGGGCRLAGAVLAGGAEERLPVGAVSAALASQPS